MDLISRQRSMLRSLPIDLGLSRIVVSYQRQVPGKYSLRPTSVEFLSLEGDLWQQEIVRRLLDPTFEKMRTVLHPINREVKLGYMENNLVGLIVALPLLGAIVNGLFGAIPWKTFPRISGAVAGVFASLCVFGSFVISLVLKINASHEEHSAFLQHLVFPWITVADLIIPFQFHFDALSGALCLVVTGVGFLIHVYSIGYMHDDKNPQRYFTYLNLFTASMLILILGANLPVLFIGWEGVGLCSYLLIGFWFEDI